MKYFIFLLSITYALFMGCQSPAVNASPNSVEKLKALIIDGQNNHGVWPKTTMMMKDYLEQTALFEVDIHRVSKLYQGPHHAKMKGIDNINELLSMYPLNDGKTYESTEKPEVDPNFSPDFATYDVVISNMGWQSFDWSSETKADFEKYMAAGVD